MNKPTRGSILFFVLGALVLGSILLFGVFVLLDVK